MTLADPQRRPQPLAEVDADEARRARRAQVEGIAKWVLPVVVLAVGLWYWDRIVAWNEIPPYVLPGPGLVAETLVEDRAILFPALLVTLQITMMALIVAVVGGVGLAVLFTQSRLAEMCFYPYAVILQVTPVVSIAPLIFIYVNDVDFGFFTLSGRLIGLLLCAWIVAFFPILASTTLGLKSADHNLRDLMAIYRATRWQRLIYLQLPSALPYFLGGLRIAGGLSLIGAVVAEYVAGTAGIGSGLAFRILEAGNRLDIPRMFAALLLIAASGVVIFGVLSLLSHLLLRKWHESALTREQ